jgi:hypothetical protein
VTTFDPAKNPLTPDKAHELISQIADLLGVEANHDAIQSALDAVFAAVTDDDGSDQLTSSERQACEASGCSPREFLQLKKSTSTGTFHERLRRQATAVASIRR